MLICIKTSINSHLLQSIRYTNWYTFQFFTGKKYQVRVYLSNYFCSGSSFIKDFKQILFIVSSIGDQKPKKKKSLFVVVTIPKKKRQHGLFSFQIVRTTIFFNPLVMTDVTKGAFTAYRYNV